MISEVVHSKSKPDGDHVALILNSVETRQKRYKEGRDSIIRYHSLDFIPHFFLTLIVNFLLEKITWFNLVNVI